MPTVDFQRKFHTGLLVRDLPKAMEEYGAALGVTWATPYTFEALPLWTPERGLHHVRLNVTYSVEGPQHLEIQVGEKGSFYDPELGSGFHVGIWVDSLVDETNTLQADGWQVVAAGGAPEDGYGLFVYLQPPGGGLLVELVSTELQPVFASWWAGEGSLG
ncbi:MAG: VOC family protein [Novosphingobium sp.]